MSYPIDLDEYRDEVLTAELARRKGARESGVCDYCGRSSDFPPCMTVRVLQ